MNRCNCPNCNAPLHFHNSTRTNCEYCGSEVYKTQIGLKETIERDYNYEELRVLRVERNMFSYNYVAIIQLIPKIQYIEDKLDVQDITCFKVVFDIDRDNQIHMQEIPKRFMREDILRLLYEHLIVNRIGTRY